MKFHYLARGIIFKNGKVLLAHQKGADNTFLPGGHIGMSEKAETALAREIAEEIGEKVIINQSVGAVECTWREDDQDNHEINLLFEIDIPGLSLAEVPKSREDHLEFIWVAPGELKSYNLQPYPLITCLASWECGYHGFWGSSF
ncbi:MAG: NUDIX domain-containing protein [Acidobacteriaceae bacterium]